MSNTDFKVGDTVRLTDPNGVSALAGFDGTKKIIEKSAANNIKLDNDHWYDPSMLVLVKRPIPGALNVGDWVTINKSRIAPAEYNYFVGSKQIEQVDNHDSTVCLSNQMWYSFSFLEKVENTGPDLEPRIKTLEEKIDSMDKKMDKILEILGVCEYE